MRLFLFRFLRPLIRNAPDHGGIAEFLAQIAAPIHHFAAGRLASPVFESSAEARVELLNNAGKLRRLHLKRENAAVVEQLHRSRAHGDAAEEDALLREVERRTREKLGLV